MEGVKGLTPYELRLTAAPLAIRSDNNAKVVQRMLGHKSATLTLDRYVHLFSDELGALAKALNDARTAALEPAGQDPTSRRFWQCSTYHQRKYRRARACTQARSCMWG